MKKPSRSRTDRPLTLADLVVLAVLSERPAHGYDLVAGLERREVSDWAPISRAQIYYSLKKLARLGLILPARDEGRPAGPEREVFRVSSAGTRAMRTALGRTEWALQRPPPPFHTWLALAAMSRPSRACEVLDARVGYVQEQIEKEMRTLDAIRADPGPTQAVALVIVAHAIEVFRLELALLAKMRPLLGGASR